MAKQKKRPYESYISRKELPEFDRKWNELSTNSRIVFLEHVNLPRSQLTYFDSPFDLSRLPEQAAAELLSAGLIERSTSYSYVRAKLGALAPAARNFGRRIGLLLDGERRHVEEFDRVVSLGNLLFQGRLREALKPVLAAIGLKGSPRDREISRFVIASPRWADSILGYLANPLATEIVDRLTTSPTPLLIEEIPRDFPVAKRAAAQDALDDLIGYLVLEEALDPVTRQLTVELPRRTRQARLRAGAQKTVNSPARLTPASSLREFAPPVELVINDLREVLLRNSSHPPRMKMDGDIYERDLARLDAVLEPWPKWLTDSICRSGRRSAKAIDLADRLRFTKRESSESDLVLALAQKGLDWLAADRSDQRDAVYASFRQKLQIERTVAGRFYDVDLVFYTFSLGRLTVSPDSRISATNILLCDEVLADLKLLPLEKFFRLADVIEAIATFKRGRVRSRCTDSNTEVEIDELRVPSHAIAIEEAIQQFLKTFFWHRLIPLGAFHAAVDEEGEICVARTLELDHFFGHRPTEKSPRGTKVAPSKVVVQPDYTVMVIGVDSAPVIDLSSFCDRAAGHMAQGSTTFKITKDSVMRAVSAGMTYEKISAKLKQHSSVPIPANVATQIKEWCGWLRQVSYEPMLVFHCPDAETANRLQSLLGDQGVLLGESEVGFRGKKVDTALRNKLVARGILTSAEKSATPASTKEAVKKAPKRRRY